MPPPPVRVTTIDGVVRMLARQSPEKWKRKVMREYRLAAFGDPPVAVISQEHSDWPSMQHLSTWYQLRDSLAFHVREATGKDFAADYTSRAEKELKFEVLTTVLTRLETQMKAILDTQQ